MSWQVQQDQDSSQIVEEWLRSLGLIQYYQSFIDNGYDDLEVCKQIGDPDLDAIGVDAPSHRDAVLASVATLREQGATHVYFTLEEAVQTPTPGTSSGLEVGPSVVAFPKLQLMSIVRDKLIEDEVDLTQAPFANGSPEGHANDGPSAMTLPFLTDLADRYAHDLRTYAEDVLDSLIVLQQKLCLQGHTGKFTVEEAPCQDYSMFSVLSGASSSTRSAPLAGPPPLPPVRSISEDSGDLLSHSATTSIKMSPVSSPRHGSSEVLPPDSPHRMPHQDALQEHLGLQDDLNDAKKKTSTISRLLRTVNLRKSGRKYTYKQHDGDLNASEITMSEEDRMQLMILVKEGKLSMQQAVEAVKQFEAERRHTSVERDSSEDRGISTESITSDEISRTPETSSIGDDLPAASGDLQSAGSHMARKLEKSRSKGFSSPSGSPHRLPSGRSVEASPQKEKKRGIFSSPFARRKTSDPKKDSRLQTVERSPQTPRRGIAGLLRGTRESSIPRNALPPLPPSRSGGAIVQSSSFQYQDRCRSSSPLHIFRRSSESHIPLPPRSPGSKRHQSSQPVYRHPYDYENLRYMSRSDTDLGCAHNVVKPRRVQIAMPKEASGSDSGLYCLQTALPHSDHHVFVCEAQIHLCDQSSQHDAPTSSVRTSKRHTPPSSTPPDSQSPKRLHVISNLVPSSQTDCPTEAGSTSLPEKEKHFGSSSTMSMGSEPSPPATIDSHTTRSHSRVSQIPRRRASSFSTGDEAMSSDGEISHKPEARSPRKDARNINNSNTRGEREQSIKRTTKKDTIRMNQASKDSSMESIHTPSHAASTSSSRSSMSIEEDASVQQCRAKAIRSSSPESKDCLVFRKGDVMEVLTQERNGWTTGLLNSKKGLVKLTDIEFIQETFLTGRRKQVRARNNSRRPRPRTVEELLERLQLQSYVETFMQNGFNTLELFSQMEEEDLNDLKVKDIQARTKLLTAAQMLLDNVENSLDDSSSLSGISNQSSSQSPVPLVQCDLTAARQRDSVSSVEGGTLKNDATQTTDLVVLEICDTKTEAGVAIRAESGLPKPTDGTRNSTENRRSCSTLRSSLNTKRDLFRKRSSSLESYPRPPSESRGSFIVINSKTPPPSVLQAVKSSAPTKKSQVPTYGGMIPRRVGSASPKPTAARKGPLVPERTVSLAENGSSSCPSTPLKQRDAYTQHGKSRALTRRSPSPSPSSKTEHLVCTNPVSTTSKVKTAHVRQITSSAVNNSTPPASPSRSKLPKSKTVSRCHVSRHDSLVGRPKSLRISLSMEKLVAAKLEEELIDMTHSPYSDKLGYCAIPISLVERYAEELHFDIWEVAQCIETCRMKALQHTGRQAVQNDRLGEMLLSHNHTVDTNSLPDFLISIGLPMYLEKLISNDITTLPQLYQTSPNELQETGIQNEAHLHRFLVAIEATRSRISQKTPQGSASHVITISRKLFDKV